jgi:hypothetical protein
MEMGTFQRVVEYRVAQKVAWLGWRTTTFTIHDTKTYYDLKENLNIRRKSVRQVWMKGDYIVMSRSLHTETPSRRVIIRKTFNPARTNWGGILGKSRLR